MSPSQAYTEAHDHILHCAEILTIVSAAIDGGMIRMSADHQDGLATVVQRALDEARAARERFPHIPRPKDPL